MKLNVNGVEIELPNNAKVDVSSDGKKVKIEMPEATEKIRVVEVGAPTERVIEHIKIVEVEKPCTRPHYPTYPTWPQYNPPYITSDRSLFWTAANGNYTIGGITSVPNTITTTGSITCKSNN